MTLITRLLLALVLVGQSLPLPLRANQWTLTTSNFVALRRTATNDAFGDLVFPLAESGSSDNYLFGGAPPRQLSGTLTATFTITATSGTPVFHFADTTDCPIGGDPASVRLFIWANHLKFGANDRWWGWDTPIVLQPGTFTLSVPLDWTHWVNVWSDSDPVSFAAAMSNVSAVGLTFGGSTCDYGHGVYVTNGTATFALQAYTVQ